MTERTVTFKPCPSDRLRLEGQNSPSSFGALGGCLLLFCEVPPPAIPHFPGLGASEAAGRRAGEALGKLVQESARP